MKTILSLYVASVKEFVRDRAAMFWTLAFPIMFIVLFGIIFTGSNSPSFSVGLVVQDSGPAGQQVVSALKQVKPFKISTGTLDSELGSLKAGKLDMVIVVPAGLGKSIASGQPTGIPVYYDPTHDPTSAQIEVNIVQQVLAGIDTRLTHTVPLLQISTQSVIAHNLSTVDFLMPGIIGMALMQLGLFATAGPLVALRQEQVLRRLGATPLPRWHLLSSQVLLRVTIGFVQAALIIFVSVRWFHAQIQGSMGVLAGLILLGALTFVGLGYLIASFARTVESASGISSAINFPMMFLSGIFFPVSSLPGFLTPVVRALPLTYLADALRQVTISSTPQFPMRVDVGVLVAWVVATAILSARLFKWE